MITQRPRFIPYLSLMILLGTLSAVTFRWVTKEAHPLVGALAGLSGITALGLALALAYGQWRWQKRIRNPEVTLVRAAPVQSSGSYREADILENEASTFPKTTIHEGIFEHSVQTRFAIFVSVASIGGLILWMNEFPAYTITAPPAALLAALLMPLLWSVPTVAQGYFSQRTWINKDGVKVETLTGMQEIPWSTIINARLTTEEGSTRYDRPIKRLVLERDLQPELVIPLGESSEVPIHALIRLLRDNGLTVSLPKLEFALFVSGGWEPRTRAFESISELLSPNGLANTFEYTPTNFESALMSTKGATRLVLFAGLYHRIKAPMRARVLDAMTQHHFATTPALTTVPGQRHAALDLLIHALESRDPATCDISLDLMLALETQNSSCRALFERVLTFPFNHASSWSEWILWLPPLLHCTPTLILPNRLVAMFREATPHSSQQLTLLALLASWGVSTDFESQILEAIRDTHDPLVLETYEQLRRATENNDSALLVQCYETLRLARNNSENNTLGSNAESFQRMGR